MNKKENCTFRLLQLFAEESVAAGDAAGSMSPNANAGDNLGQPATDTGTDSSTQAVDKKQEFQRLISGDYKGEYEELLKNQISRRIKSKDAQIKKADEYRGKIAPVLEKLAAKYGITDANDIDRLIDEVNKDNSYYQNYASANGVSVEQAKTLIEAERIKRENMQRQQYDAEMEQFQNRYSGWMKQAELVSQKYPSFNFEIESQNDDFRRLLNTGIDVETAYTVIHRDEIMSGALQYGYQRSKQEMADSRTMRNQRPNENGVSSQQAAGISDDITKLSSEQMEKINAAVLRGEKVTLENFRQFL